MSKKEYKVQDTFAVEPQYVNEPIATYGTPDYFELASRQITKDYIKSFLDKSRLRLQELIDLIPISIDTYKRKAAFNTSVTEKVLEIQEVYQAGLAAFGEGFYDWMEAPNPALGGDRPKALLRKSFGIRRLLNEIGRIQHGVLA